MENTTIHKKIKKKNLIILILVITILISTYILLNIVQADLFEYLKEKREVFKEFFYSNLSFNTSILFLLTLCFVVLPIPLAGLAKTTSGFLFGSVIGTIFNIFVTTFGCFIGYFLGKYIISEETYDKYRAKVKKVDREFELHPFLYIIIYRLSLVFPFFAINLIGGMSKKISFTKYMISSFLSVIPTSLIYAFGGAKLGEIDSLKEIFTLEILLFLIITILFLVLVIFLKKIIVKKKKIISS